MTEKEMQEAEAICAAMAVPGLSGSDYAIAEARFRMWAHAGWPAALAEVRRLQAEVAARTRRCAEIAWPPHYTGRGKGAQEIAAEIRREFPEAAREEADHA